MQPNNDNLFTLPELPYEYGALGHYISADIMRLHHDKSVRMEYMRILVAIFNDHSGLTSVSDDAPFQQDLLCLVRKNFSLPVFVARCCMSMAGKALRRLHLLEHVSR